LLYFILSVLRLIAQHGKVHLFYQILRVQPNNSLTTLPSGEDFRPSSGFIEFNDKQDKGTITVKPFDDSVAELNETFAVRIFNATGMGNTHRRVTPRAKGIPISSAFLHSSDVRGSKGFTLECTHVIREATQHRE